MCFSNVCLHENLILENLLVEVTYDIANDCGLDAQAIMNEVDNTLKSGLIAATTTTTIDILNQTYPRIEDDTKRSLVHRTSDSQQSNRYLAMLKSFPGLHNRTNRRYLVYYTDNFPVTMDNVIDVTEDCPVGNNCLLIVSTITTVLEDGDDPAEVKNSIEAGIRESFSSGSFYQNIPSDTVICPDRKRKRRLAIR